MYVKQQRKTKLGDGSTGVMDRYIVNPIFLKISDLRNINHHIYYHFCV